MSSKPPKDMSRVAFRTSCRVVSHVASRRHVACLSDFQDIFKTCLIFAASYRRPSQKPMLPLSHHLMLQYNTPCTIKYQPITWPPGERGQAAAQLAGLSTRLILFFLLLHCSPLPTESLLLCFIVSPPPHPPLLSLSTPLPSIHPTACWFLCVLFTLLIVVSHLWYLLLLFFFSFLLFLLDSWLLCSLVPLPPPPPLLPPPLSLPPPPFILFFSSSTSSFSSFWSLVDFSRAFSSSASSFPSSFFCSPIPLPPLFAPYFPPLPCPILLFFLLLLRAPRTAQRVHNVVAHGGPSGGR